MCSHCNLRITFLALDALQVSEYLECPLYWWTVHIKRVVPGLSARTLPLRDVTLGEILRPQPPHQVQDDEVVAAGNEPGPGKAHGLSKVCGVSINLHLDAKSMCVFMQINTQDET